MTMRFVNVGISARGALLLALVVVHATLAALSLLLDWSPIVRASIIGSACVLLWLSELVRPWVPTLILWLGASVLLWPLGAMFAPMRVVSWSIDPVLALFLGGFAFALAAERRGVDRMLVNRALQLARGNARRLVIIAAVITAMLSMWISNVAAAALVLGAMRTVYEGREQDVRVSSALLLGVALAADVAGIATPVGSGPNGIAIATLSRTVHIDFLHWMAFGVPLTVGLLTLVLLMVSRRVPADARPLLVRSDASTAGDMSTIRVRILATLFAATLVLWLSEPLHGIAAWKVAMAATVLLVATTVIKPKDLFDLDWSTLLLVAGGIAFGTMLEEVGVMDRIAPALRLDALPRFMALFVLCLISALLSALMSNTATATLLVPLGLTIDGSPATAILIAVACSLGVPFVISTPPNAMAVARGLRSRELLGPGLFIMIGGCALIAATGHRVLALLGIR